MTKAIVSLLLIFFTVGCAHQKALPPSQTPAEKPKNITGVKKSIELPAPRKSPLKGKRHQVFWRLIGMESVTLLVQSVAQKSMSREIHLNQQTFYHSLPSGDWQIHGFKAGGKTYHAINSQRANFKVFSNAYSYAGALVIHCPKVGPESFEELKLMKFFNRYSFAVGNQLCEMVVGNDYDLIKDAWPSPSKKAKKPKLLLGI